MLKAAFRMYKKDLKTIFTNYAVAITMIGLCILPSLYAWINIKASWDPYAQEATQRIKVAVVNNDTGASLNGKSINMGDRVIEGLKENDLLGWQFLSEQDALVDLKEGKVYAELIIPQDFSSKLTSFVTEQVEKPEIRYIVNEKLNAIAPKITDKGATGVQANIDEQVVSIISEIVLDKAKELGIQTEDVILPKLAEVAKALQNVEGKFGRIDEVVNKADEGVSKVRTILDNVHEDMPELKNQLETHIEFIAGLNNFLSHIETQVKGIMPTVKENIGVIDEITRSINDQLSMRSTSGEANQADEEAVQTNAEINKANINLNQRDAQTNRATTNANQVETQANEANIDASQTGAQIGETNVGTSQTDVQTNKTNASTSQTDVQTNKTNASTSQTDIQTNKANASTGQTDIQTNKANAGTSQDTTDVNQATGLLNQINGVGNEGSLKVSDALLVRRIKQVNRLSSLLLKIMQGMDEMGGGSLLAPSIQRLEKIQGFSQQLQDLGQDMNAAWASGSAPDDTLLANMRETAQQMGELTGGMYDEFDSVVGEKIRTIFENIQAVAQRGQKALEGIEENLPELSDVLVKAGDVLENGQGDLENIKAFLPKAEDKIKRVSNELSALSTNEDLLRLIKLVKEDVQQRANFLAQTVVLKEEVLFPMGNYGSQMAPFYSSLAAWVGLTILVSMLSVDKKGDYSRSSIYFGKLLLYLTIALTQCLIIGLGDLYLLKIYCSNPVLFILSMLYIAIAFTFIVYSLVSVLGNIGKVVAIILMILQVAGSGGTFPVQLTSPFFIAINPYLPFTYAISMLRECIGGIVSTVVVRDLIILAGYSIVMLLIAIFLKRPVNNLMKGFTDKLHEGDL